MTYTKSSFNIYDTLHSFKINNEKFINSVILNEEAEDVKY